jgi:hypothetical protein
MARSVRAGANLLNAKLFLCGMDEEKNIEHPTSNVEWEEIEKREVARN